VTKLFGDAIKDLLQPYLMSKSVYPSHHCPPTQWDRWNKVKIEGAEGLTDSDAEPTNTLRVSPSCCKFGIKFHDSSPDEQLFMFPYESSLDDFNQLVLTYG
jgi:hypothetical protein